MITLSRSLLQRRLLSLANQLDNQYSTVVKIFCTYLDEKEHVLTYGSVMEYIKEFTRAVPLRQALRESVNKAYAIS